MTSRLTRTRVGLLLQGCAALLLAAAADAAAIPDFPFVFVTGLAGSDLRVPPDVATCSLTLHAVDPDPGKADSAVDNRLKAILAILTAKGVAAGDIESFDVNKQILTAEYGDKGPVAIRGYDLTRNLQFKARQLGVLPAIQAGFVGSPNVERINCQFDRSDRAALEADLTSKALRSAKEQADSLAQPLGRHVTTATAISKMPFESIPGGFGLATWGPGMEAQSRMFRKAATPDELLVPSTIHLSVTVNVIFKME